MVVNENAVDLVKRYGTKQQSFYGNLKALQKEIQAVRVRASNPVLLEKCDRELKIIVKQIELIDKDPTGYRGIGLRAENE